MTLKQLGHSGAWDRRSPSSSGAPREPWPGTTAASASYHRTPHGSSTRWVPATPLPPAFSPTLLAAAHRRRHWRPPRVSPPSASPARAIGKGFPLAPRSTSSEATMYSAEAAENQRAIARLNGARPSTVATPYGAGPKSLRRRNMALVARTLLDRGSTARSEIAQATGLSATSVTKITAQMMNARMLVELAAVSGGDTGRPRVPVVVDTSHYRFIGIHIGLRRTTGGLLDLAGNVVEERAVT